VSQDRSTNMCALPLSSSRTIVTAPHKQIFDNRNRFQEDQEDSKDAARSQSRTSETAKRDQLGGFCIWLTRAKRDKHHWSSEECGELQDFIPHVESHPVDCLMALTEGVRKLAGTIGWIAVCERRDTNRNLPLFRVILIQSLAT
jgi:hypothetical protein